MTEGTGTGCDKEGEIVSGGGVRGEHGRRDKAGKGIRIRMGREW